MSFKKFLPFLVWLPLTKKNLERWFNCWNNGNNYCNSISCSFCFNCRFNFSSKCRKKCDRCKRWL